MDMQNVSNLVILEGSVRTIHDKNSRLLWGKLSYDTKYAGNTVQDGTPTPDAPIPVQTVTGEQTVTIGDGVGSEDFAISLGSLELCKIGDYQDYIYKSGDDWYVHKEVRKYTFTGTENWSATSYGTNSWFVDRLFTVGDFDVSKVVEACDFAQGIPYNDRTNHDNPPTSVCYWYTTNERFLVRNTSITTQSGMQNATAGKNVYYWMTPTDTKIIDSTLISQLDAIHQFLTRYGYNATVSGNLPIIIDKTNL